MANISLYICTDENERINKTNLSAQKDYSGYFRDEINVMTPVFQIETTDNLSGYNYANISDFGRYYFVKAIKAVRNGLWELSLAVDVLMTYRTALADVKIIAARSEVNFNQMLTDKERATYQDKRTQTYNFPRSLDANGNKYYLVLTGGTDTFIPTNGGNE